jgi:putative glutamine amidotransferase
VELVPDFLDKIDGLVITGGAFDVDPALFGEVTRHEKTALKENRTAFEWAITKGMLAANKPVLGICGGEQLLAVILGGTLIQHIPDSIVDALPHEQPNPRDEAGHDVDVVPHTLLHRLVGQRRIAVNSAHHQAVRDVPDGVCVNARADDGVIEGIESPAYKFCLGVQWHPEFHISPADEAILQAFVDASR